MSHLVATATGMWTGCGGGLRFCRSKRVFLSSHFNGQMHGVEIEDSNGLVAALTIHQSSCVILAGGLGTPSTNENEIGPRQTFF